MEIKRRIVNAHIPKILYEHPAERYSCMNGRSKQILGGRMNEDFKTIELASKSTEFDNSPPSFFGSNQDRLKLERYGIKPKSLMDLKKVKMELDDYQRIDKRISLSIQAANRHSSRFFSSFKEKLETKRINHNINLIVSKIPTPSNFYSKEFKQIKPRHSYFKKNYLACKYKNCG